MRPQTATRMPENSCAGELTGSRGAGSQSQRLDSQDLPVISRRIKARLVAFHNTYTDPVEMRDHADICNINIH
jgi:hypothetical protein